MHLAEPGRRTRAALLVIEDPAARGILLEVFEELGFTVLEAKTGDEATELAASARPVLMVVDVSTGPDDALALCTRLRKSRGAGGPLLALAEPDDANTIGRLFEAGATDFAAKPLTHPVLRQRIRHMLRSQAVVHDLRRSEATLEAAQRIARLGNWDWDLASGRFTWSEETPRLLGYPADFEEPQFHDFLARVHPDDGQLVARSLEAALRGERTFDLDYRIVRPDGSVRFLHAQAEIMADARGQAVRMSGTIQDITGRKKAESQIRFLAYYDNLTGLPNRIYFSEQLKKALAVARRKRRLVAVMFMDLDNFKKINDSAGHSAGDHLLRVVADRLKDAIRTSDVVSTDDTRAPEGTVARLGGDEFIVLLPDIERAEDTARVARRILESFKGTVGIEGNEIFISTSIGISIFPQDGNDPEELLKNADVALYHAKDSGRNNFQFYSPSLNDEAFRRLSLESSLRKALERNEFVVYYQPQVRARDGRMVGVEALIRWNHPDLGLVYPGQFIPLAEETGLIMNIDEWVLRQGCAQVKAWQQAGFPEIHVAVNLSGCQFRRKDLLERVDAAVAAAELDPTFVELEITESVLMENAAETVEVLNALKSRGFRIAVDDFGTGYSSLAYLKRFRADVLKIDRSFVRDIATSPDDAAIVAAVVTLAETLKMAALAEGVENPLQRAFLHEQGCDLMQGHLFGKPAPAEETERLLRIQAGDVGAKEKAEAAAAAAAAAPPVEVAAAEPAGL